MRRLILGSRLKSFLLIVLLLSMLSACLGQSVEAPEPTRIPGDITDAAAAQATAQKYLEAWQVEDYAAMYALLTPLSRDAISEEDFINDYHDAVNNLTLDSLSFQIRSAMADNVHAEVAFRVDFSTLMLGDLSRDMVIGLSFEQEGWRVQWDSSLILPEMAEGNQIEFVHQLPSRGRILDRDGAPLAAYESAIAIGIVPGELHPDQAETLYETLAEISIYSPETLRIKIENTPDDWYLPVVTLSQAAVKPHMETLRSLQGVRIDEFRSRYYVDGGVAPHILGYMLYIPEEELETYLRQGYRQDERIGVTGLEAIYEQELSGKRGGSLYLMSPQGEIGSLITSSAPEPGHSLYTTLDKDLQMLLQASLGDLRAAAVVMEVDTGRVIAMVSNPTFDPNAFDLTVADRSLLDSYFTDADQPLFNRGTQGQYPLGSVFKVISMSAALETGLYRAGSSFFCGHSLWVCDSVTLYDWTLAHGVGSSGELTLVEGLMRSCNPWFYRIGENLYAEGMESSLSEMAFGFGLGKETGIEIEESAGNIPETAATCVANAQMAIGQGEVLVTPLQVAAFFTAVANGGTLYRPALVEQIQTASGDVVFQFEPEVNGKLPISEETLASVQEGLRLVIEETRGTGYWAMQGLDVAVSGKTGTAQTPTGNSHAWFAGYTRQNDPDRPDIAVAVIIENGGEGSVMAAPVFRRIVSLYFSDYTNPAGVMPWETEPYITAQPTPTPTSESTTGE